MEVPPPRRGWNEKQKQDIINPQSQFFAHVTHTQLLGGRSFSPPQRPQRRGRAQHPQTNKPKLQQPEAKAAPACRSTLRAGEQGRGRCLHILWIACGYIVRSLCVLTQCARAEQAAACAARPAEQAGRRRPEQTARIRRLPRKQSAHTQGRGAPHSAIKKSQPQRASHIALSVGVNEYQNELKTLKH